MRRIIVAFQSECTPIKPMRHCKPKCVFFDLGNTLVCGTTDTPHESLIKGLGLTEKEGKKAGRLLMTSTVYTVGELVDALKTVLPNHSRADVAREVTRIWEKQDGAIREIPGAERLVRTLKESGVSLCLISNTWFPYYSAFLEACAPLSRLFDYKALSFELGIKKPSPAIFRHALELVRFPPSECLFVGDSFELDICPARLAGIKGAWILSRPEREAAIITRMLQGRLSPPEIVAENLAEFSQIWMEKWP